MSNCEPVAQQERPLGADAQPGGSPTVGRDTIVVLDFGSQYSQLIARRVRECRVYCELLPWDAVRETVEALRPRGVILSGGPASVYERDAPLCPGYVFELGVPILGICYGMQLLAHQLGGRVAPSSQREYGHATLQLVPDARAAIFRGLPRTPSVWMSHGDRVVELPPGFSALARTDNSPVAAMADSRGYAGLQFHPEVAHTPQGVRMLQNFCYDLAGCRPTWTTGSFITESVAQVRAQVGAGRVLLAFSGGVDSTVAAALIHRAVGDQLRCVFVDNGLLRKGEADAVATTFSQHLDFNLRTVDASAEFLAALAGVTDPEEKRRIIGRRFVRVFEREAERLEAAQGRFEFLAQGTIYPDVIESAAPERKAAARIKTHHNVGGLPLDMRLRLVEPLRYLFKDEVRAAGSELGLPDEVVWRQPFPGPGLAVRVLGEVTPERLAVLREADAIVLEEIQAAGWHRQLGQYFAVLTPVQTTGVMGDFRTYGYLVAVRAVVTTDFMTVDWAPLPHDLLGRIADRIVNEVPGVNRVVYDITSKPPATVEWE